MKKVRKGHLRGNMINTLRKEYIHVQDVEQTFLNQAQSMIQAVDGLPSMKLCQGLLKKLKIIVMGCVV